MPENTDPLASPVGLLAKVENLDLRPVESTSSLSALDALMAEQAKGKGASEADIALLQSSRPVPPPAPVITDTTDLDDAAAKSKADAESKVAAAAAKVEADKVAKEAADKIAADAEAAKNDPAIAAAQKVEADKIAAAKAAADKSAGKDEFDKIELPAHTSPKAGEQFTALKSAARAQVTALQTQLTDITSKHTEAARQLEDLQKQKAALTPEVQAELEDLRKFKIAQDVESDPQFRTFKNEINANHEAIYKKLMGAGYTQENIDHIKSLGGPDNIDWNPLLEKLPAQTRLFLQGKLVANIELADKRDAALEAAKASGPKFLAERAERDSKSLLDTANSHLTKLEWTATRQLPATATPEQKTAIEAWNKDATEAVDTIKMYLSDRSPERHAELAIGTLIAHRLQRDLGVATTKLSTLEAAHKTAIEAVTAERDKLKADLEKIKLAAIPRTTTPVEVINPAKKPVTGLGLNVTGMEALDAHYAAVHAQTNV